MSHVRMCDNCSVIFSETERGWQTFTAPTMEEDDNGIPREIKQALDACPSCADAWELETRLALEGVSRSWNVRTKWIRKPAF